VNLIELYDYDVETGVADTEHPFLPPTGAIGGTILSSAGAEAGAAAGKYDFDLSGVASSGYDIRLAIVYDESAACEVTKFTVEKVIGAPSAPTPIYTVSKNTIKVQAEGKIEAELSYSANMSDPIVKQGETGELLFTGVTYGAVCYLRVRVIEDGNHTIAQSAWSAIDNRSVSFPRPTVSLATVDSSHAVFTAEKLKNTVEAYAWQHRVGSGQWTYGLEVNGLKSNTSHTISFRAVSDEVEGEVTQLSVRTLRAPVTVEEKDLSFNEGTGELSVLASYENAEYRLLSSDGEVLVDWGQETVFAEIETENLYHLQIRYLAENEWESPEITDVEIDTHKPPEPIKVSNLLSDWFLAIVGVGVLILLVLTIRGYSRVKKRVNEEEFGGLL